MGLISSPSVFTAQPQYPAPIDYDGLGRGAILLFNPAAGSVDLAAGRVWTPGGNAGVVATAQGRAFNFDGSGDSYDCTGYPELVGNIGTFFMWCPRVGNSNTYGHIYLVESGGAVYTQVIGGAVFAGGVSSSSGSLSSWFNTNNRSLVISSDGTAAGTKCYLDGVDSGLAWTSAPGSWPSGSKALRIGGYQGGGSWDADVSIHSIGRTTQVWGAREARAFHQSKGNALYKAPEDTIWIVSGGAVPLASNSTPTATGSGTLSVAIPITGASAAGATGQGTLSISLPLAGAGNAAVVGSATLSIAQALLAPGLVDATGQGSLRLAIPFNSAALANVIGSGTLNGSVALGGNGAADVSGQGTISLSLALSAAAIANVLGSGNLAVSGSLGGASAASVTGSASLSQAIPIQSASLAGASASGNLTQLVPITASSVVLATGQAGLILNIGMSAAALAQVIDVGDLTLRIALNAASVASATAAATLLSLPTPASRTISIQAENRTLAIKGEDRTLRVAA